MIAGFGTTWLVYTLLGTAMALYMGDGVKRVATHTWSNYDTWGISGGFGQFISTVVLLYPTLGVSIKCYILCTRSLAEAMEGMIPLRMRRKLTKDIFRREYDEHSFTILQFVIRESIAAITLVLCIITYRFKSVLALIGVFAFGLMFFFPVIIHLKGFYALRTYRLPVNTRYRSYTSRNELAWAVVILAVVALTYYIYSQVVPAFE